MANSQKRSRTPPALCSVAGAKAVRLVKGASSLGARACLCVYMNLLLCSPNYSREARIQWQWRTCHLGKRNMQVSERDLICTSSGCCSWGAMIWAGDGLLSSRELVEQTPQKPPASQYLQTGMKQKSAGNQALLFPPTALPHYLIESVFLILPNATQM